MFGRRFARRFYQGEGFPWEQGDGPQFGPRGPRGAWAPGFGPGFGPSCGRGPRGGWGGFGPGFGGRAWGEGQGQGPWQRPEFSAEAQALRSTAGEVARLFAIAGRNAIGNPEKQAQLRTFLESSRKELLDIIGQSDSSTQSESQSEQV